MKILYYLSITSFSQVDFGILHELSKYFKVFYGVVIPKEGSSFSESDLSKYCKKHSIIFEPFHVKYRQRDIRITFEYFRIINSINSKNPDIIYTFSFDNPLISLLSILLKSKKTIINIHDVDFHSAYPNAKFLRIGRKLVIKRFKYFQVFSSNQKNLFQKKFPNKILFNIPLPLSSFGNDTSCNNNFVAEENKIRFLFFGNVLTYKGLHFLINAVNNLSEKYENFELIIAGRCANWDKEYQPLIRNEKFFSKNIRHIQNSEIPVLFKSCHFLVLPYSDATQSGPLMIAYNYKIPVIVSDIISFKEAVIEGESGYFFKNKDVSDLERVMEKAITNSKQEYDKLKRRLDIFVDSKYSSISQCNAYIEMFSTITNYNQTYFN